MSNPNAKAVRGLSIAVVVLSVLVIVTCLITILVLAFGTAALTSDSASDAFSSELMQDPDLNSYQLNTDELMELALLSVGLTIAAVAWPLVCSIISLIAGILGIRNADNTEKLGSAFGWSVVGIVVSFLSFNIIIAILLIISAVYINKIRNAPMVPYGQPQAYTAYGQQTYAQPYGQPCPPQQQSYGQPYSPQQPLQSNQQPQNPTAGQPPINPQP